FLLLELAASLHFSLVFFYMLLPPLNSTPFPYTTLFRSEQQKPVILVINKWDLVLENARKQAEEKQMGFSPELLTTEFEEYVDQEDRKSTRLNSSHVKISYAVFCLKKKKRKKITSNE